MAEAEEPSLIQLLEGLADKNRAPLTPKVAYAPARMKPSGAQAALAVGVRSRSPRRAQSPPSPLRQQSSHGEDGEQLDVPSSLHDERLSFRINNPQRVDPPRDLKAPKRTDNVKPVAQRAAQVAATLAGRTGDDIPETQVKSNRKPGNIASRIKDHTMLAAACRRAGRTRDEGLAYYNIGVLFDNNMEYDKAIKYYEQFVDICKRLGDAKGEALAFNSIGVDYQKLGMHDEAINFHQLHLEVADVPGKFVAHSNLGIAYAAKEENEKASLNHRQALRYAIVMSSLPGESLACGNLGVIGSRKGDATTAKACMERHLKLSGALRDDKAQADAYVQLGQLANTAGEYEDASQYFEMARTVARKTGEATTATAAKCHVGMALGNLQFEDYLAQVSEKLVQ